MSYQNGNGTTLIARRGYATGLGAMNVEAASTYCGTRFGVTSKDFQPCVDHYKSGKAGDYQPGAASSGGSVISTIGGTVKDLFGGMLNAFATAKGTTATPFAPGPSGPPAWLVPAAIGGVGLVAFLLIRRSRSATPAKANPARRRRKRRIRRNPRRRYHRRRR